MPAPFDNSREHSNGDLVSWMRRRMTHYLTVIEDSGEEIAQVGVDAVRSRIEEMNPPRIDPDHDSSYDGPEQMIQGVRGEVTGSKKEDRVNIKVGWDLTQYRDGYPELQDRGFGSVVGMEALSMARIAMATAAQRALNNSRDNGE